MKILKISHWFVFLVIFPKTLSSQIDYTVDYFPEINKAELHIVENQFHEALEAYKKAFNKANRGFIKDYYNAVVCAIEIKNTEVAFQYLDSLVKKGLKRDFFMNNLYLSELRKDKKWSIFTKTLDAQLALAAKTKNTKFRQILKGIDYADQEFRSKNNAYTLYRDTINKIDKANVEVLKRMIDIYGFPSEDIIEVDSYKEIFLPSYLVIFHQYQKKAKNIQDFDFTPLILKAIKKGEIDPHRLAYWTSTSDANFLGGKGIITAKLNNENHVLVSKYSDEEKILINERRLMHGLESLEDFKKKALFATVDKNNQKFNFEEFTCLTVVNLGTKGQLKHFLSFMEELK